MSRDDNRQDRRGEEREEIVEETTGSSGLGREAKIGVTVIALLLVTLGGVIAWRMMKRGSDESVAAAPESNKDKPAVEPKAETAVKDTKPKPFPNSTATVVPAKAAPGKTPKADGSDSNPWKVASDHEHGKRPGENSGPMSSPPAFMPDAPKPPHANRDERYGMEMPSGRDRDSNGIKPLRDADNEVRLVGPSDERPSHIGRHHEQQDDSSGFAMTEPAPIPPRYRDQDEGRVDNTPPAPPRTDSRRLTGNERYTSNVSATPTGRYGTNDPGRDASEARPTGFASRRTAVPRSPAPQRGDGKYEVQPNDSYWTISEQLYGSGAYFKALAEHNRGNGKSEEQLQPGTLISAPSVAELEKSYPDLCPKASRREAVQTQNQSRTSPVSARRTGRTYTVAEGDTLFNIARYELGKASRWVEIYELNRDVLGKDFNYLTPGTQLAMPDGEKGNVTAQRPGSTLGR